MTPELRKALVELLRPAGEAVKETLHEVDQSTVGHVLLNLMKAHVRGELDTEDDVREVVHDATKPRNP